MSEADPLKAGQFQILLKALVKHDASDLHLKVGSPPVIRVKGDCRALSFPPLTPEAVSELLYEILSEDQMQSLQQHGSTDLAYVLEEGRYRVNVYRERGHVALAVRRVHAVIPTFGDLRLPADSMARILQNEDGLVLVCGATGSGKSTTIAAAIEQLNTTKRLHIATVEDPIEYAFQDRRSVITQREVGIDVPSFREALRQIMRQDPDVVLIGEMRDGETFDAALAASETGHLVFSTIHASTASQAVLRILELYPEARHGQIRLGLHFNLRAIVCQKLLPSIRPEAGVVVATEVMLVTPIVKELLRKAEDAKIPDVLRTSRDKECHDFNSSLHRLIQEKWITEATALEASPSPEALRMRLQGIITDESRAGIVG